MAKLCIAAVVDGVAPAAALTLITDYRRWPGTSAAVRSVEVERLPNGTSISCWEVTFRGGLMRWSERDAFDAATREHTFILIEGDPHFFSGSWTAEPHPDGCRLRLLADFDLGMPSLHHVLDPIAIEALEDAIGEVLEGLFGGAARLMRDGAAPAGSMTEAGGWSR